MDKNLASFILNRNEFNVIHDLVLHHEIPWQHTPTKGDGVVVVIPQRYAQWFEIVLTHPEEFVKDFERTKQEIIEHLKNRKTEIKREGDFRT